MEIEKDLEFYCFLKKKLPEEFQIYSFPSKDYFSEWFFHYKIFKQDKLYLEFSGDFREIEPGSLVRKAVKVLTDLKIIK